MNDFLLFPSFKCCRNALNNLANTDVTISYDKWKIATCPPAYQFLKAPEISHIF